MIASKKLTAIALAALLGCGMSSGAVFAAQTNQSDTGTTSSETYQGTGQTQSDSANQPLEKNDQGMDQTQDSTPGKAQSSEGNQGMTPSPSGSQSQSSENSQGMGQGSSSQGQSSESGQGTGQSSD